jgi:hypothetical protein
MRIVSNASREGPAPLAWYRSLRRGWTPPNRRHTELESPGGEQDGVQGPMMRLQNDRVAESSLTKTERNAYFPSLMSTGTASVRCVAKKARACPINCGRSVYTDLSRGRQRGNLGRIPEGQAMLLTDFTFGMVSAMELLLFGSAPTCDGTSTNAL